MYMDCQALFCPTIKKKGPIDQPSYPIPHALRGTFHLASDLYHPTRIPPAPLPSSTFATSLILPLSVMRRISAAGHRTGEKCCAPTSQGNKLGNILGVTRQERNCNNLF
eukprot:TRINITY_DN380_c0_g1_i1.p2 TRINITY_DN380_c0_g1~~TRINITY_DN380_c0_g1_i1.p2  ORF type:complete len:109 (+),score=12.04 TRINITY_DN380_c0_g1_i1:220-546(+)